MIIEGIEEQIEGQEKKPEKKPNERVGAASAGDKSRRDAKGEVKREAKFNYVSHAYTVRVTDGLSCFRSVISF